MELTEEQRMRVQKAASIGHEFYDCLILANVSAADAVRLCKDHGVRDLFHKGRAEGSEKVRERLMIAAMGGNVSAMKALALHEAPDEDGPPQDTRTDAERRADWQRIEDSVNALFRKQKELHELHHDELNRRH